MRDYHFVEIDVIYTASRKISFDVLARLEEQLAKVQAGKKVNLAFLYLYAGQAAALANDGNRVLYYYKQLSAENVKALFFNSFSEGYSMTLISHAVGDLAKFNHFDEAERIVRIFDLPVNRSSAYAYAAQDLLLADINDARTDRLIDSARAQLPKTRNLNIVQGNRIQLAYALALRDKPGDEEAARNVMKNVEIKFFGTALIARALARHGKLFEAYQYINTNNSSTDNVHILANIFRGYNDFNTDTVDKTWSTYKENRSWLSDRPMTYEDEVN
jgi:hypothetical protein